jgi:hypothetical protein
MRSFVLTFAISVLASAASFAQTSPQLGRIKVGSVTVRSGPGEQMPACGTLEQGAIVIVDHPEGADWIAIQPPPGSLSWINHLYVELRRPAEVPQGAVRFPCDAVIVTEGDVKIAAGVMGESKPLNVQRTKLPEGSIVRIVGPKVRVQTDESETTWYPITPPRGDFRFLPRAAVEIVGGERNGFVVQGTKPGEGSNAKIPSERGVPSGLVAIPGAEAPRTVVVSGSSSTTGEPTHPTWQLARQAERDGNYELAERYYKQLADENTKPDGDTRLVNLCYVQIQQNREWRKKKGIAEPEVQPKAQINPRSSMIGEGVLRATTVKISGQPGYALTTRQGEVKLYVITDGIELERYIGRVVELSGTVAYPSNLGGLGLLTASKVEAVK